MSEEQAIYRVVDLAQQVINDQEDTGHQRLARRVATHYTTLLASGMDAKTVRHLTEEFQSYLLCTDEMVMSDMTTFEMEGE